MRKIFIILIGLAFLAYGLLRLGVGGAMLGQELGFLSFAIFDEPLQDVGEFLGKHQDQQFIPMSVAGYVGYIALMGLTLTLGAFGALTDKRFGLPLIAAFILMYAALFINFQTVNQKIFHLAISALLFVILAWLKRRPHL